MQPEIMTFYGSEQCFKFCLEGILINLPNALAFILFNFLICQVIILHPPLPCTTQTQVGHIHLCCSNLSPYSSWQHVVYQEMSRFGGLELCILPRSLLLMPISSTPSIPRTRSISLSSCTQKQEVKMAMEGKETEQLNSQRNLFLLEK